MRKIKMLKDLDIFHQRRQSLLLMEKDYFETKDEISKLDTEKSKILEVNKDIAAQEDIVRRTKDVVMSKFRLFVTVLDYMLAYVILSYYSEFIPFIPVWIKALIAIVAITIIEYVISLFEKENKKPTATVDPQNPFAYNEEYESQQVDFESNTARNKRAYKFRHLFITVLPLVSLATMFQEIATVYMDMSFEEDLVFMASAHKANMAFVIFKYVGLAACSYASHYFLTEYSDLIVAAKSRLTLEKKCKDLDKKTKERKENLKRLETKMIKALMDFHQKLRLHIATFGKHEMLPSESFTQMLDDLYLKVNGSTLT